MSALEAAKNIPFSSAADRPSDVPATSEDGSVVEIEYEITGVTINGWDLPSSIMNDAPSYSAIGDALARAEQEFRLEKKEAILKGCLAGLGLQNPEEFLTYKKVLKVDGEPSPSPEV